MTFTTFLTQTRPGLEVERSRCHVFELSWTMYSTWKAADARGVAIFGAKTQIFPSIPGEDFSMLPNYLFLFFLFLVDVIHG